MGNVGEKSRNRCKARRSANEGLEDHRRRGLGEGLVAEVTFREELNDGKEIAVGSPPQWPL